MEGNALKGVVYGVIHPRFRGYTKIGKAVSARKRLASYNTGDPRRQYQLAFAIDVPDRHHAERIAHLLLDGYRNIGTEWFRIHHAEAFNLIHKRLSEG